MSKYADDWLLLRAQECGSHETEEKTMSEYETGECKTCELLSDKILKMEDKLIDAAVDCGRQAGQLSSLRSENRRLINEHTALVDGLLKHVPNLTETIRMPNREWVADDHNAAVEWIRAAIKEHTK